MHQGLSEAIRWYLAPFARWREEQLARPIDIYVPATESDATSPEYAYFFSSERRYTDRSLATLFAYIVWDVIGTLARTAQDYLFLHAGAVSIDGATVVFPAEANHGKTSLVTELLRRGFSYLSDEYGCIDPVTSAVYPFEKPLHFTPEGLEVVTDLDSRFQDRKGIMADLTARYLRPEDVGASVAQPSPATALVFPSAEWHSDPTLIRMSQAEAVEELARNCLNLDVYGERGLILLGRLARSAPAFALTGGSPAARAGVVAQLVADLSA